MSRIWTAVQATALQVVWAAGALVCASAMVLTVSFCDAKTAEPENFPLLCPIMLLLCCVLCQSVPCFPAGWLHRRWLHKDTRMHLWRQRFAVIRDLGLGNCGVWDCTGVQSSNDWLKKIICLVHCPNFSYIHCAQNLGPVCKAPLSRLLLTYLETLLILNIFPFAYLLFLVMGSLVTQKLRKLQII